MMKSSGYAFALLGLLPVLTGCKYHTRAVVVTHPPARVLAASQTEIIDGIRTRYDAVTSLTARVEIVGTQAAGPGVENVSTALPGHILIRKPGDLRVLLTLPFVGTRALDMVSTGGKFKMLIPSRSLAMTGTDTDPKEPSKNALENLRPFVFFDSLLVKPVREDALAGVTGDTRTYQPNPASKELIEEPDYDLHTYLQKPNTHELLPLRVIHIGRENLLPYQQDIYDPTSGQLVTTATYEAYKIFDGPNGSKVNFPSIVNIRRPLDKLSLKLTIFELYSNEKLDDDQFELTIPPNIQTRVLP